jgi:hypothetical protein
MTIKKKLLLIAVVMFVLILLAYSVSHLYEKPVFKKHKKNVTVSPVTKPTPISIPLPQMWYGHVKSTARLPIAAYP